MNYQETLEYLYARLPMFQRIGTAAYKKDLTNTVALCAHLGNPHHQFPSIHVGGTNGKGSVSHMLAALFQAAGLKTGLYISPHYRDFRERIKVDGRYIPHSEVVRFVAANREAIESIEPSFFEACVGMAFDHFAREKVDIAIIEVGLGGRLDSTNVITPLMSVITNISFDHMNLLGDSLPQIAFEKAGIIKPGIPVVIGETHPESAPVFVGKAAETNSSIEFADQHYQVELVSDDWLEVPARYRVFRDGQLAYEDLTTDATGPYQTRNLATFLQAVAVFDKLPSLPPGLQSRAPFAAFIRPALADLRSSVRLQGRWQVIGRRPAVLIDSAHNEAGIGMAIRQIDAWKAKQPGPVRVHIVTGFVNDKDVERVLRLYPADARYYFAKADIPRGLPAATLREKALGFGLQGRAYSSVANALRAARRAAAAADLIGVIGSVFVAAEVVKRY